MPTPIPIIESLANAAKDPKHHQYPSYEGMLSFRKAVADWYKRRFNVTLDPANEVLTLIGSKEGIGHIHLAFVDPGDVVLVPRPGYPVYPVGTSFSGGTSHIMPLTKTNGFLPDLGAIPKEVAKKAKVMWLNSPNNPTSVIMTKDYFKRVVEFAQENQVIVCHDAAYSEVYYDGCRPASFMEVEGAKDVGVEFHSLSKTYNMTGWRIGFAAGRPELIGALTRVKSYVDTGPWLAIQQASVTALDHAETLVVPIRDELARRRDAAVAALRDAGFTVDVPKAAMYLWVALPDGIVSAAFARHALEERGVVVLPGSGFGPSGEGYFRIALVTPAARLSEAIGRLGELLVQARGALATTA